MWKRILTAVLAIAILALAMGQAKRYGRTERYYAEEVRPVADKIWVSNTGDMNAAASYSPSGVPINGDSLAFTGSANGGSDVSATINVTALDDITLSFVRTYRAYPGDIGTVGTASKIGDGATTTVLHQGTGTAYIGATVPWLIIDSPNTVLAAHISGESQTRMSVRGGAVQVAATATMTRMDVSPWRDQRCSVELMGTTAILGDAWITGGTVRCERDQTGGDVVIAGGTWVQERASTETFASVNVAGGTFVYNGGGALSSCVVMSGLVDFSEDARAKTVTTLTILPGGDYISNEALTITSLRDLRGRTPRKVAVAP